jgi:four helix bundle protein
MSSAKTNLFDASIGAFKSHLVGKLSIALKEANETDYWLSLLKDSNLLTEDIFNQLSNQCEELIKMLVASIKTAKTKVNGK